MTPHLSSNLGLAAADLVHRLGGVWRAGGAMCFCPAHDDGTASLSVRIGRTSLLLKCFAGCPTIDVLRAIRLRRLAVPVLAPGLRGDACADDGGAFLAARVSRLWNDAVPVCGSPAQAYLQDRRIEIFSAALRYHPRTPFGAGRAVVFRPAMLAAVTRNRKLLSVQRLFLDIANAALARDTANPRRMLGRPFAGAVTLQAAGTVLGLAEGVETALSASMLLDIPVWAALGNERLPRIDLPAIVRRLVLLPDNDRAGRLAAVRGHAAYSAQGFAVDTLWPWHGLNDWNDVLRAKGEGAGRRGSDGSEGQTGCARSVSHVQSHPVRAGGELREIALERAQAR